MAVSSGEVQRRHTVNPHPRLVDVRTRPDQRPHYRLVAHFSGVAPLYRALLTSAPNSISARTTVSWPFSAAAMYSSSSSHGQPFSLRPLQHLEVPALRRPHARPLVPRAVVRARPLQHLEVPAHRREHARF